jgi:hypothetical protein
MNEKETADIKQEAPPQEHLKKQPPRYTHENKKETRKVNESQTGKWSTGKKQRQQRNR